jgi:hypothetical protein
LKFGVSGRRPHFWYVVLVNCQPDSVINQTINQSIDQSTGLPIVVIVAYDFHLTNSGDFWTNQQHVVKLVTQF